MWSNRPALFVTTAFEARRGCAEYRSSPYWRNLVGVTLQPVADDRGVLVSAFNGVRIMTRSGLLRNGGCANSTPTTPNTEATAGGLR